ncbi:lysoplasmalogenase [Mesorhizobium sp. LHD-90]|uniref:lysoplasmalogenase n=1 Tax=Mesorhizobium sp. LHD-90 TaxID=3071414 RepID=UPI0027E056BF|nr:lysoplasmalogenase [Mesorhizobium sp. LHD-90]MDQ6432638.1 lysoplasmalogenase [Mesorhizobium sp. LHD-90]
MMPFDGGVESPGNATFIFSCGAALLYGTMAAAPPRFVASLVKTLAVALLAVLAAMQGGHWLLVLALALSAAGDLFLSRPGEKAFLAGLASFLAAHIAYIVLFATIGGGFALLAAQPWRGAAAAVLTVYGLVMLVLLWRRIGPELRLPVAVYIVAILGMGISALTLDAPLVIFGALLFIVSDTLLAGEKFLLPAISRYRDRMRYAVWGTYYLGQLAITLGLIRF